MKKYIIPLLLVLCLLCSCAPKKSGGELNVKLTVDVLDAMRTPDLIPEEKQAILPESGILLEKEISFSEGENAYDVVLRTLQSEKLHYEADSTKYFLGIGNLYAGDCGELSGWLYSVNGESPTVGASQYILQDGDVLRFYYVTMF